MRLVLVLILAVVAFPLCALADGVSNPPTRLQSSSITPDGGCSGTYASYRSSDNQLYGCSGGHMLPTSSSAATSSLYLTASANAPAFTPSVSSAFAIGNDATNPGGSILWHWTGSTWATGSSDLTTLMNEQSDGGVTIPGSSACVDNQIALGIAGSTLRIHACSSGDINALAAQLLAVIGPADPGATVIVDDNGVGQIGSWSGSFTCDGSGVCALSSTGVGAATWGDATHVPRFTTTAEGRLSTATSVAITYPSGTAHCNLNAASPSTCTATVSSAWTRCACSYSASNNTDFNAAPNCSISATTMTVFGPNGVGFDVVCLLAP